MLELLRVIPMVIGTLFISVFMFTFGTLWTLGYCVWLPIKKKDWNYSWKQLLKILDNTLATFAIMVEQFCVGIDKIWNVWGELIEDIVTHEDDTTFGDKDTTVSASIGKLQSDGKLNKAGRFFSMFLNLVFWQKDHALDSWQYKQAKDKIDKEYFEKID